MDYKKYFGEEITDEEILRSFAIVLPYLSKLISDDAAVTISDNSKYISYSPGKGFDLKLKYGDEIVNLVKQCLVSRGIIKGNLSCDVLEKEFKVRDIPISNSKSRVILHR